MSSRAARKPCWKLDRRLRTRSGETEGIGATPFGAEAVSAEPGTRFALGTRLGSPAAVAPSRAGSTTASARCQPASALAEPQLAPSPLCSNQADSTEAKIGRYSSPDEGGLTTGMGPVAADSVSG